MTRLEILFGHNLRFGVENQKIAAFGSSYMRPRSPVGAAEGCDLLILTFEDLIHDPISLERLLGDCRVL
jgi:hypothetical protein